MNAKRLLNTLNEAKMMKLTFGIIALFLSSVATAAPITLTFDSTTTGTSYTEAGMTITSTASEPVRTDGNWFLDCCDSAPETFSITTGGTFDLLSVFIGHVDYSDPVVWTGYSAGALVATNSFNTGQGSTYSFTGLTGVDLVTVSVSGNWTDPRFDNLTYEEVPEPAIIAIFGLGLLGLGFARRK